MAKRRRDKGRRLSLYKTNPDAAISAFMKVDPGHLGKNVEISDKPELEAKHGKARATNN